jgi:hypothetical protein
LIAIAFRRKDALLPGYALAAAIPVEVIAWLLGAELVFVKDRD